MTPEQTQPPQGTTPAAPQAQPALGDQSQVGAMPSSTVVNPTVSKKHIPKWLKIVGIVVLVFAALIVIATVATSSATKAPQKISDQFVNDVQAGNTSSAYALTSSTFQQETTEDRLDQVVKQVGPALQGEEKVSGRAIQKSTGTPQTAVLVYTVTTSAGSKYIKVELQKTGDAWQVVNFRSSNSPLDTTVE